MPWSARQSGMIVLLLSNQTMEILQSCFTYKILQSCFVIKGVSLSATHRCRGICGKILFTAIIIWLNKHYYLFRWLNKQTTCLYDQTNNGYIFLSNLTSITWTGQHHCHHWRGYSRSRRRDLAFRLESRVLYDLSICGQ
jgi:hypothetical protein